MADKLLKSLTFPDLDDKYIIGDKSLANSGAAADAKATGEALATKANIDGSYADLSAGTADQLNTDVRANDKVPYIFRTTGGSVDVGDREYVNAIVGGTVAWNQMVQDPLLTDANKIHTRYTSKSISNGVVTCVPTSDGTERGPSFEMDRTMINHIYLAVVRYKTTVAGTVKLAISGGDGASLGITANTWTSLGVLIKATDAASNPYFSAYQVNSITTADTIEAEKPQFIDLTQMFGSTIADYIYSLETANAGAGVAFFKKLGFNKPYYAYDSGTLKSVEGLVSHDTVGFNAWDEEWELGGYGSAGEKTTSNAQIRSKNKIKIVPNTAYYFEVGSGVMNNICFYDADENYISSTYAEAGNQLRVTPSNAYYLAFQLTAAYGTTYKNDICINLAWDNTRNGEYEPYIKHSYPLDNSVVLRGMFKLDANNNLYADGDIYPPSGEVARRYGVLDIDDFDEIQSSTSGGGLYWTTATGSDKCTAALNCINTDLKVVPNSNSGWVSTEPCISTTTGPLVRIYTDKTSKAAFKAAYPNFQIVYELATPTTETADPYTTPQICDDFGTEEYVFSDSVFPVPVGSDTDYPINMRSKLEMAPNSPSGDGDYIVRQTNGMNSYVPLVIEDALPTIPSTNGTYKLTVTVASGSDPVLSWEAE